MAETSSSSALALPGARRTQAQMQWTMDELKCQRLIHACNHGIYVIMCGLRRMDKAAAAKGEEANFVSNYK